MFLTARDHSICLLVARFGYLKTGHVRALVFPENRSDTSADRRLKSLRKRGYLRRIERRLIGGDHGGSGQYIYALDHLGRRLFPSDSYKLPRLQDVEHTLAIADTYIAALSYAKSTHYEVVDYATEPRNWLHIKAVNLRPDLYLSMGNTLTRKVRDWWLEVDLANQRDDAIKDKMERYYHVWQQIESEEFTLPAFPYVVFLVPDEERRERIRKLIAKQPPEGRELFRVELRASFPQSLLQTT